MQKQLLLWILIGSPLIMAWGQSDSVDIEITRCGLFVGTLQIHDRDSISINVLNKKLNWGIRCTKTDFANPFLKNLAVDSFVITLLTKNGVKECKSMSKPENCAVLLLKSANPGDYLIITGIKSKINSDWIYLENFVIALK